MRLGNVLLLLMLAPIASGCATLPPLHQAAMQPGAATPLRNAEPPARAAWASSLDNMAYGEPARVVAPPVRTASNPFSALARLLERRRPAEPSAVVVAEAPPGPLVIPPAHMQLPTPKGMMGAPAATVVAAAPAPVALRGSTAMASAQPVVEVALPAEEVDGPYTVDTGDRLRIVVFGQEGLSNSYVVDAQGNLSLPLIGTIPARGHTTEDLSRNIADHLRKGFIREPHVSIEVESYRPFFILGEVIAPGQYPYVPHMTVETAVAIAGGYTPRAYRWETHLDRRAGSGTVRTSVPPLAHIKPGDTLTVKERWF
jgi:polysaccharide export outer membrane protein